MLQYSCAIAKTAQSPAPNSIAPVLPCRAGHRHAKRPIQNGVAFVVLGCCLPARDRSLRNKKRLRPPYGSISRCSTDGSKSLPRSGTSVYYIVHRDWCDHICLHSDGSFARASLGGEGHWRLEQVQHKHVLRLRLTWRALGAASHANVDARDLTRLQSPSGDASLFSTEDATMQHVEGPLLSMTEQHGENEPKFRAQAVQQQQASIENHGVARLELPIVGFGTAFYPEDLARGPSEERQVEQAVRAAVGAGVRLFDCANQYSSQRYVGVALQRLLQEGAISRDELIIVAKIPKFDTREDVAMHVQLALHELRVSYVDVLMPHIPPPPEAWAWFEAEVDAGRARHLGVSNYDQLETHWQGKGLQAFQELLQIARIAPEVHELELHPLLQNHDMVEFCQTHDIQILSYSPLGAPHKVDKYVAGVEQLQGTDSAKSLRFQLSVLEHPVVRELAARRGVSPALLVLRWHVQRGFVAIPKSFDVSHVAANAPSSIASFELDESEIRMLDAMDAGVRTIVLYQKGRRGEL